MISVLINGITGRMGRAVYTACNASEDAFLAACGIAHTKTPEASIECPVYRSFSDVAEKVDVVIDFSVPAALPAALRFALSRGIPIVVGTTGLSERDHRLLAGAAEKIPVFQTGNMSLGVNLQLALTRQATAALGAGFDAEIVERHHKAKIDAPSGTALMLAEAIASQHPEDPEYAYGRHEKNKRRGRNEIGLHSIRGGTIVGEHEVLFIGKDEVLEITHKAYSKQVFAVGALRAAAYALSKRSGLYSMQDVVTEHDVASHLYTLENQAVVSLSGLPAAADIPARVFAAVADSGVFVDMISMSLPAGTACDIGFSLAQTALSDALNALKPLCREMPELDVHVESDVTKLCVEGSGMALRHGVAARLFRVLSDAGVPVLIITTSETKIELGVSSLDAIRAVAAVRQSFLCG
ncbi:MAG: 4-hydroxy-tetrahydrodipicolinate reductase [Clostridia bacterium]|nr:4-hydroxy-tetrahydrodipicolinate reductase [Clostridia bacterium]